MQESPASLTNSRLLLLLLLLRLSRRTIDVVVCDSLARTKDANCKGLAQRAPFHMNNESGQVFSDSNNDNDNLSRRQMPSITIRQLPPLLRSRKQRLYLQVSPQRLKRRPRRRPSCCELDRKAHPITHCRPLECDSNASCTTQFSSSSSSSSVIIVSLPSLFIFCIIDLCVSLGRQAKSFLTPLTWTNLFAVPVAASLGWRITFVCLGRCWPPPKCCQIIANQTGRPQMALHCCRRGQPPPARCACVIGATITIARRTHDSSQACLCVCKLTETLARQIESNSSSSSSGPPLKAVVC